MKETPKLDLLRLKCLTFTEFFLQKKFFNEDALNKVIDAIEQAHKEKKTKILDALNKDYFYQMREAMPATYLLELKKIWLEKVGEEFNDFQILIDKKINKIIKRGIKSLDDYEIVHNEVETIWDDSTQKEKLDILNNLLNDWHKKHP